MGRLARTIRGAMGVGLTWAWMWAFLGALLAFAIRLFRPGGLAPGENEISFAIVFAIVGFVSGALFALVLALAERRRTLGDLSLRRAALWGAVGSAALPLLTAMPNGTVIIFAPLGALFAASSVALAKREARRELAANGDFGLIEPLV